MRNTIIIALFLSFVFFNDSFAEQKGEIKRYEGQYSDSLGRPSEDFTYDPSDTDYSFDLFVGMGEFVAKLLLYFPDEEEDLYHGLWPGFSDYPYAEKEVIDSTFRYLQSNGYLEHSRMRGGLYVKPISGIEGRSSFRNATIDYFRSSHDLAGYHLGLRFGFAKVLEASLETSGLTEQLANETDHLQLSNLFIDYNRFRFSSFVVRWGIGYKFIGGSKPAADPGVSLGLELYPVNPVACYYRFSGFRVNKAFVSEHELQSRLYFNRYFLELGYHLYKAGTVGIEGSTFGMGVSWQT